MKIESHIIQERTIQNIVISPTDGYFNNDQGNSCLHRQTIINISTQNIDSNDMFLYMSKLWNFSAMACMIMSYVIYNMLIEDGKFIHSI